MMNRVQETALRLTSLSIYRGILERPVPKALHRLLLIAGQQGELQEFCDAWGSFFSALCQERTADSLLGHLTENVLYDENIYSVSCAANQDISETVRRAVERDLQAILQAGTITPEQVAKAAGFGDFMESAGLPKWQEGQPVDLLQGDLRSSMERMKNFYHQQGCGVYAQYRAFIWRNQRIEPVLHPDTTRLADLKEYEYPRNLVLENTLSFLHDLPANNCLLYGDRGTGKSSTVKAILNEYYSMGLRVIEMPKEFLMDFPHLVDQIAALPMKFIIFIDDLSFSKQDDTYASLKAVLEGGVAVRPANTLIYATSNRRHLIRETFSDREGDEIHRGDTIQESLSLADRFGLSVNFGQPNKAQFLEIVRQLALQRGLDAHVDELVNGAEAWALERGGRSPRCARQYINACEAKIKLGRPF